MSQRLHIGKTNEKKYDCVIDTTEGVEEKLHKDWLRIRNGIYFGPWKIYIRDYDLYKEIEPEIEKVFTSPQIGARYPDDIWVFYNKDRCLEHPTRQELDQWLMESKKHV